MRDEHWNARAVLARIEHLLRLVLVDVEAGNLRLNALDVVLIAGLLYAVILPMLPGRHMLWGGLVAPLMWTGLLWAVLGIINPTLNATAMRSLHTAQLR